MEPDKQYARTIQKLSDAIYVCDVEGYVTLYNKAAADLWGREPELGKDLFCGSWKIYNRDGSDLQPQHHPIAITLREKKTVQGTEIIIHRPDGTTRNVIPYSSPLFDVEGHFAGAVNMLVDITGRSDRKINEHNN